MQTYNYIVAVGHVQKAITAESPEKALHSAYPKHLWTFKGKARDEGGVSFEYTTTVKRSEVAAQIWEDVG